MTRKLSDGVPSGLYRPDGDASVGARLRDVIERIPVAECVVAEFFEWFKDRNLDLCEIKDGMHRNVLGMFSDVYPCPICTARKIVGDDLVADA